MALVVTEGPILLVGDILFPMAGNEDAGFALESLVSTPNLPEMLQLCKAAG